MKRVLVAALTTLPGGILIAGSATVSYLVAMSDTGIPALNKLRLKAAIALLYVFKHRTTLDVMRTFMAILRNEGAYTPGTDETYPLGDVGHKWGPAIGPGQVLRVKYEEQGYTGDLLRYAKVGNELGALTVAARVFRKAVDDSGGDMLEAARRYNGAGAAAEAYADRAITWRNERWS